LPAETPLAFGMHPNAEIDFRTNQCVQLFKTLVELQPKDGGSGGEGTVSRQDKIQEFIEKFSNELSLDQNRISVEEVLGKLTDERTPYQNVFL